MNKKIKIIILFFLLVSFFYGYFLHKYQIFPYQIAKNFQNYLLEYKEKNSEFYILNKKKHIKYYLFDKKVKSKYKKWDSQNKNLFIQKVKFFEGINIFSDRSYFNHLNSHQLIDLTLIRIPRHHEKMISLDIKGHSFIYRALCDLNDNKNYDNWQKLDFELRIVGTSCIHSKVVRLKVSDKIITLNPGGPVSADPIFIGGVDNNEILFKILN